MANFTKINPVWIKVVTDDESLIPEYQTAGSAGCDLKSTKHLVLRPGTRAVIGTGLKLEMPSGFAAQVCPRSGLAAKYGVTVLNAPGCIDNDFLGEIKVILYNSGYEDFIINEGDRIAQLIFFPIFQAILQRATSTATTDRGEGGFGSTGI